MKAQRKSSLNIIDNVKMEKTSFYIFFIMALCLGFMHKTVLAEDQAAKEIQPASGSISGRIQLQDGKKIINDLLDQIHVLLYTKDTKDLYIAVPIKENGNFIVNGLPYGNYYLRAQSDSLGSVYYDNVYSIKDAKILSLSKDNASVQDIRLNLTQGKEASQDVFVPINNKKEAKEPCKEDVASSKESFLEKYREIVYALLMILFICNIGWIYLFIRKKSA